MSDGKWKMQRPKMKISQLKDGNLASDLRNFQRMQWGSCRYTTYIEMVYKMVFSGPGRFGDSKTATTFNGGIVC